MSRRNQTNVDATYRVWGARDGYLADQPTVAYLESLVRNLELWLLEAKAVLREQREKQNERRQ